MPHVGQQEPLVHDPVVVKSLQLLPHLDQRAALLQILLAQHAHQLQGRRQWACTGVSACMALRCNRWAAAYQKLLQAYTLRGAELLLNTCDAAAGQPIYAGAPSAHCRDCPKPVPSLCIASAKQTACLAGCAHHRHALDALHLGLCIGQLVIWAGSHQVGLQLKESKGGQGAATC